MPFVKTHGKANTPEYNSWLCIKQRTGNPNNPAYSRYGGRGIDLDPIYIGENGFIEWLKEVGERPSPTHSIDRIDNNKGYFPGNMRWATKKEQSNNRRPRKGYIYYTHEGITKSVAEWARYLNTVEQNISYYRKLGRPFSWIINHFKEGCAHV